MADKAIAKRTREILQDISVKQIHRIGSPASVKFNPEVMETSYGGTCTPGKIKETSVLETSISSPAASNLNVKVKLDFPGILNQTGQKSHELNEENATPRRKSENMSKKSEITGTSSGSVSTSRSRRYTDQSVPQTAGFSIVDIDTPQSLRSSKRRITCDDDNEDMEGSCVTVAVRVRPLNTREIEEGCVNVVSMVNNQTTIASEKGETHRFTFDHSFWSLDRSSGNFAGQKFVYENLAQPILSKAFDGYNTCLFAYGQTGSGKSYSIMGDGGEEESGIIPRFCEEMFLRMECSVKENVYVTEISYFEIYNEKIYDLLAQGQTGSTPRAKDTQGKKNILKVREHPCSGPYVEGLSCHAVSSFDDIKGWLSVGNKNRFTATTAMNDKSSRSHAVFTILLKQTQEDSSLTEFLASTSRINIVDLAGSERQSQAKTTGERLREGASINKSLMVLGKVIHYLAEQSSSRDKAKKMFIPYRDSVLTWLLKESLGGNSKTAMLATISPASVNIEETLSTLRYANQARNIINVPRVDEDPKTRLIKALRAEIEALRSEAGISGDVSLSTVVRLRQKLVEKDAEIEEMARAHQEQIEMIQASKENEPLSQTKTESESTISRDKPPILDLSKELAFCNNCDRLKKRLASTEAQCQDLQRHKCLLQQDNQQLQRRVENLKQSLKSETTEPNESSLKRSTLTESICELNEFMKSTVKECQRRCDESTRENERLTEDIQRRRRNFQQRKNKIDLNAPFLNGGFLK